MTVYSNVPVLQSPMGHEDSRLLGKATYDDETGVLTAEIINPYFKDFITRGIVGGPMEFYLSVSGKAGPEMAKLREENE